MELLDLNRKDLEFSCAPSQYRSLSDGPGCIGSIGCVGYTGIRTGKLQIPDSMLFTINPHGIVTPDKNKLLGVIFESLELLKTDDILLDINRSYNEYIELYQEYIYKYTLEECEYTDRINKFVDEYYKLTGNSFKIPLKEFSESSDLINLR